MSTQSNHKSSNNAGKSTGKRKFIKFSNHHNSTDAVNGGKLNVNGNVIKWKERISVKIRAEHGSLADELNDPDYTIDEDYPEFETIDIIDEDNMTSTERITLKAKLDAHERRIDKVVDQNKSNKKDRAKVVGLILAEVDRELIAKCEAAKTNFSRDCDNLYEFMQYIIDHMLT